MMDNNWKIPTESPLSSLDDPIAQDKIRALRQHITKNSPETLPARSLNEARAFCLLMRKTPVAYRQANADLDVLVIPSTEKDPLNENHLSLYSFKLTQPHYTEAGMGTGPSPIIPPQGYLALAMRTVVESKRNDQKGGAEMTEKINLAVYGILDIMENIPLDQMSLPKEAFGNDGFYEGLSPTQKAQFTRAGLIRLVGHLRSI